LRQAYDYWQNQPGNYPEPRRASLGSCGGEPPEGRSFVTRVGATRLAKPDQAGRPARRGAAPSGHPIAPTEFPKGRSAAGHSGPKTAVPGHMRPSGGGLPSRVNTVRRILAMASPQRRCEAVAINQPPTDTGNVPANPRDSRASVPNCEPFGAPWTYPHEQAEGFASPTATS
jgi:hypothetical protein